MKYRIKIIKPSDLYRRHILDALLNRIATGFQFDCGPVFAILKTDSIAWLSIAIELLEAGNFSWEAISGY